MNIVGRKVILLLLIFLGVFIFVSPNVHAQESASTLAELTVDIWPDYDRSEVLFLMTGRLPDDSILPVEVTIPLPDEAQLNAVARITSDNLMVDDIDFSEGDNSVTLVIPDARFRVEFYLPYTRNGDERQFTYRWLSNDLDVTRFLATIQQPAVADSLDVTPGAETEILGGDGLTYHNLPVESIPAGEPYSLEVVYFADSDLLTESVLNIDAPPPAVVEPSVDTSSSTLNLPLIFAASAGVLVLIVVAWQVLSRRQTRTPVRKPRPVRPTGNQQKPVGPPPGTSQVNFCHQCGTRAQPGDRFCRNCGTTLKQIDG